MVWLSTTERNKSRESVPAEGPESTLQPFTFTENNHEITEHLSFSSKITNSLDWCYPKITFRLVSETSSYEIWSKSTHFPSTDFSQRSREHIVKEWSCEWRRCWTWLSICRRMKLTLIFHHTQKTTQNELKT